MSEFWCSRLESAYKMRVAVGIAESPENNTYRLVHGEGDNLPGLGHRLLWTYCRDAGSQRGHARMPYGDSQGTEEGDGRRTPEHLLQERDNPAIQG